MALFDFTVHVATLTRDGILQTNIMPAGERTIREVATLAALEAVAVELATAYGLPCAVWVGPARGVRKPRGFDAVQRTIANVLRNPPQAVEVAS
jgi:hypothetical protein